MCAPGLVLGVAAAVAAPVAPRADGQTDAGRESAAPSARAASAATKPPGKKKPLCDANWDGGFITIQIGEKTSDGRVPRPYNPNAPEEPWEMPGGKHLFTREYGDAVFTLLGKFPDRESADKFLARVETESKLRSMTDRWQPPFRTNLGAYLVSDQYACTIDRENPIIDPANWIVELSGYLVVGDESECKGGRKKKKVTIVDCGGRKNLVTDTWSAPCDASPIESCLFEMAPGVIGIQQDYSASGEGRQLSFRVYDAKSKKRLFAMTEGYDRSAGDDEFTDVVDTDGDGIPELAGRSCIEQDCGRTWVRKWTGRKFEPAKN